MSNSLLSRMPVAVKLGVPLATVLLAAACGSAGTSSTSGATAQAGSTSAGSAGTATAGGSAETVITTRSGSAGQYLTDGAGRAVYMWVKDTKDTSACYGACAGAWPPVLATGKVVAEGGAKASELGTTSRTGGGKQVTYDGWPLYYYAGDSGAGTTTGQGSDGFGAKWWLLAPSGAEITTTSSSSSSGGY